jgi:hypothetical protein
MDRSLRRARLIFVWLESVAFREQKIGDVLKEVKLDIQVEI